MHERNRTWFGLGKLKREYEYALMITKIECHKTHYVKVNIDDTLMNSKCSYVNDS